MKNLDEIQQKRRRLAIAMAILCAVGIIALISVSIFVSSWRTQEPVIKQAGAVAESTKTIGIQELPFPAEFNTVVRCYSGDQRYFVENVVGWRFENNMWTLKNKSGRISYSNMPCYFEDIPEMKEGR